MADICCFWSSSSLLVHSRGMGASVVLLCASTSTVPPRERVFALREATVWLCITGEMLEWSAVSGLRRVGSRRGRQLQYTNTSLPERPQVQVEQQ